MSKTEIIRFNIRVYGILIQNDQLLLSTETLDGFKFTKFPGGGLEFGEGMHDCLKREFNEELDVDINVLGHIYTTDFFQQSAFRKTDQVVSVYFRVEPLRPIQIKPLQITPTHNIDFFWFPLSQFGPELLTFPIDKRVAEIIPTIV